MILSDPFFRLYVFGSFDGALSKWGLDLRKRLAPTLLPVGVVGYLVSEFCAERADAERVFRTSWDQNNLEPTTAAIVAGGADAIGILQGETPTRLAAYFGYDSAAPVSEAEIAGFLRYFKEQERQATL